MVLAREVLRLSGLTGLPQQRAIFLRVRLRSAPIANGNALADVSHPSQPGCVVSTSDPGQIAELSVEGILLSSIAPTLKLSGSACNKSVVFASFATLLLLTQFLVCCIDRLNPRHEAAIRNRLHHRVCHCVEASTRR